MWASPQPAGSQPGRRGGCLRGAGGAEGPGQINEKGIHVLTTWQLPSCGQVTNSPPRGLDTHLFREPPKSRQAMAFFMSVPPKMEGAMLLETTS